MTLLVNITDLQLKLGNFVDERHEGESKLHHIPSSKLGEMQQTRANTSFSAIPVGKYNLGYTQQRHLLTMKKLFFQTHPLKLVCVLALKC